MNRAKWIFYRWMCGWAGLVDDLLMIVSIGFIHTSLKLRMARRVAIAHHQMDQEKHGREE